MVTLALLWLSADCTAATTPQACDASQCVWHDGARSCSNANPQCSTLSQSPCEAGDSGCTWTVTATGVCTGAACALASDGSDCGTAPPPGCGLSCSGTTACANFVYPDCEGSCGARCTGTSACKEVPGDECQAFGCGIVDCSGTQSGLTTAAACEARGCAPVTNSDCSSFHVNANVSVQAQAECNAQYGCNGVPVQGVGGDFTCSGGASNQWTCNSCSGGAVDCATANGCSAGLSGCHSDCEGQAPATSCTGTSGCSAGLSGCEAQCSGSDCSALDQSACGGNCAWQPPGGFCAAPDCSDPAACAAPSCVLTAAPGSCSPRPDVAAPTQPVATPPSAAAPIANSAYSGGGLARGCTASTPSGAALVLLALLWRRRASGRTK